MPCIKKITRLTHPGVLSNFTWPHDLPAFARFNLIYGWNGSGKTTLSRFFRHMEQRSIPTEGEITISLEGLDLNGGDFGDAHVPVRVFNRDFVNESVFPVTGGDVPPILVVGKESVDKQMELDRLREGEAQKVEALQQAIVEDKRAERELDQHCIDRARVIKDTLRVSGSGLYNDYNKRTYRDSADQMAASANPYEHLLDEPTRSRLFQQHQQSIRLPVEQLQFKLPDMSLLYQRVRAIAAQTIASSVLRDTMDDSRLADWLYDGLNLHREQTTKTCLFCRQSLPTPRLASLEAHFSAEYDHLIGSIDQMMDQLNDILDTTNNLLIPDRGLFYDDIAESYEAGAVVLQETQRKVLNAIASFVEVLVQKRAKPFESIEFHAQMPELDASVVDYVNAAITNHNLACKEFVERTSEAREGLAKDMIAEHTDDYRRLANTAANAKRAISEHHWDDKGVVE